MMHALSQGFERSLRDAGGFHKYQKQMLFLFLLPVCIILPCFCLNLERFWPLRFFSDFYCNVPGRERFNLSQEEWRELTTVEFYSERHSYDQIKLYPDDPVIVEPISESKAFTHLCTMRNITLLLENKRTSNEDVRKMLESIKDTNQTNQFYFKECPKEYGLTSMEYKDTLMLTFQWPCSEQFPYEWLSALGFGLSTLIVAPLADRFGRRLLFFICCLIQLVFGLLMICVANETALLVFYTLKSMSMPAALLTAYVIVLESTDKQHRLLAALIAVVGYHIGLIAFPPEVWLWWTNWRICLVLTPLLAVLPMCYWMFLKESSRWLNARGKQQEAAEVISEIKRLNNEATSRDQKITSTSAYTTEDHRQVGVTKQFIFRLFIILLWSISSPLLLVSRHYSFVRFFEYGYMTAVVYAIMAVVFAITSILVYKFGRRWPSFILMLLLGLVHIGSILSYGTTNLHGICRFIRMALTPPATFTHLLFVSEVLPTTFRVTALSILHLMGFIVTIGIHNINASPYAFVWYPVSNVVSGILILFLPEMIDLPLPDQLSDVASVPENQKMFSLNRNRGSTTIDENDYNTE